MKTISQNKRESNMKTYSNLRNADKSKSHNYKADENGLLITNAKSK